MSVKNLIIAASIILLAISGCSNINSVDYSKNNLHVIDEVEPIIIPLLGKISERDSEISGLCWYNNLLLLLPQYPNFISNNENGIIYYLKKKEILKFLSGEDTSKLFPKYFSINLKQFSDLLGKGSGFEAISAIEDTVYLTIENMNNGLTNGFIVSGIIDTNSWSITLDRKTLKEIPFNIQMFNMSCETIAANKKEIIPIFEANGKNVNPHPKGYVFDKKLKFKDSIDFPSIEYRITDATEIDDSGKFWAINYFYPGDGKKLKPTQDSIFKKYGIGKTHQMSKVVERLLQFELKNNKIMLTDKKPIYLKLQNNDSRNWEGLAKLDNIGFLIATDTFPETILAFLKYDFK